MVSSLPDNQSDIQYIFFMEMIEKYYNFQFESVIKNSNQRSKKIISFTNEKSLQALSECGKMEAVEIEKELAYEIS